MKNMLCRFVSMILVTMSIGQLEAASLKVGPAGFIIHNVTPGTTYDVHKETGLQLKIYNDSAVTRTYLLSTHRPSEGGKWEKGYLEIPDPTWCRFEQNEITVEANSNAPARFHLKIPGEDRYYNQHWVVTLNVAGKPGSGGGVGVAINVRAQIETRSRADLNKVIPDGLMGVVPSVLTLQAEGKGEVIIFNNGPSNETYKVYTLTDKETFHKYISAGLSPFPEADWIRPDNGSLMIPAGGRTTLGLTAALPETHRNSSGKHEAIIFVEGQSASGFVRVRIPGPDEQTEVGR